MLTVPSLKLGMASKTRTLPVQSPVRGPRSAFRLRISGRGDGNSAQVPIPVHAPVQVTNLVIYHNEVDETWTKQLAERIRGEGTGNRQFAARLAEMRFSIATENLAEAEKCLGTGGLIGIVVSARMLQEDWPAFENLITVLSELGLGKGRIIAILKENVTMPPFLRLREWFDFREGHRFEENIGELMQILREVPSPSEGNSRQRIATGSRESIEPAWKARPLFSGAKKVSERIVSNLFPAVELPKDIFSAETHFQNEPEILNACGGPGPAPFLLKGSKLYSFAPLTENSVFGQALKKDSDCLLENFSEWFADAERAPWAIQILNQLLRYHAWKRGMRFDETQRLFYFTRSKPKSLWWEIGGKTIQREVTAPHIRWNEIGPGISAEVQYGWRHEAIRAEFIYVAGALFLRMDPAWFLTELDGKTPATSRSVGPVDSLPQNQSGNGQVLRTLRFWSAVFAKGHRELRIETGRNPIRVRLTPASGTSHSVISNDQVDFDNLALTDVEDAQLIPELVAIER